MKTFEVTQEMKDRIYPFHEDAGHGWLEVPVKYLWDLGIRDKITSCSYRSEDYDTAYLEEDLDAGTFLDTVYGKDYKEQHRHLERVDDGDYSFIRGLPSM